MTRLRRRVLEVAGAGACALVLALLAAARRDQAITEAMEAL